MLNLNNDILSAKLSSANCTSLSIPKGMLGHICEGWGTAFCVTCPFSEGIPEACPLRIVSECSEDDSIPQVECCACELVCPCNRTENYDDVQKAILLYDIERVMREVLN